MKGAVDVFVWVHRHRYGTGVFLFDRDCSMAEVIEHIEYACGKDYLELDRDDEWLEDLGAYPVFSKKER